MANDWNAKLGLDTSDFTKGWNQAVRDGVTGSATLAQSVNKIGLAFNTLTGPVGLVVAAIAGLATGIGTMISLDENVNKVAVRFGALAANIGYTGRALLDELSPAVKGIVSDLDLMKVANDALTLGISKDFIPTMVKFANISKQSGQTTVEALQEVMEAVGRGSYEIANNFGIVVKAAQAQEEYAAKLGVTTKQLTEQQKAEAISIAIAERMTQKVNELGDTVFTSADQWKKWGNNFKNFFVDIYLNWGVPTFDFLTQRLVALISYVRQAGVWFATLGAVAKDALTFSFSDLGDDISAGVDRFAQISAEADATIAKMKEVSAAQRAAFRGDKNGNPVPGTATAATPSAAITDYDAIEKAQKSAEKEARRAARERERIMDQERITAIKAKAKELEELDELETQDYQWQRDRRLSEWDQKINEVDDWYAIEYEKRAAHQMDMEALNAEYDERITEIESERMIAELDAQEEQNQRLLEQKAAFFENASNLFYSYADNQANIADYIAGIKSGEIKTEQLFQDAYKSLMANLPGIFGDAGKKLVGVMQAIEAAKGIISTYSAAAQALAELPYPTNIAAAASLIGIGLGYVSQIVSAGAAVAGGSSGSSGRGGGSSASLSASASQTTSTEAIAATKDTEATAGSFTINIMGDILDENYVDLLAERISTAVQDRNVTLKASQARVVK